MADQCTRFKLFQPVGNLNDGNIASFGRSLVHKTKGAGNDIINRGQVGRTKPGIREIGNEIRTGIPDDPNVPTRTGAGDLERCNTISLTLQTANGGRGSKCLSRVHGSAQRQNARDRWHLFGGIDAVIPKVDPAAIAATDQPDRFNLRRVAHPNVTVQFQPRDPARRNQITRRQICTDNGLKLIGRIAITIGDDDFIAREKVRPAPVCQFYPGLFAQFEHPRKYKIACLRHDFPRDQDLHVCWWNSAGRKCAFSQRTAIMVKLQNRHGSPATITNNVAGTTSRERLQTFSILYLFRQKQMTERTDKKMRMPTHPRPIST